MPEGEGAQGAQGGGEAQGGGSAAPAAPAFDPAALQQTIQDSIKAGFEGMRPAQQQQEPRYEEPRFGGQHGQEQDPVTKLVAPIVAPALQHVSLQAQAAMDAATFYATNPDMVKFKDKIEEKFSETMRSGRPVPREDIKNWMRGGPMWKEMVEDEIKRRSDAVQNANDASTAGGGGRPQTTRVLNARDLSDDDLQKGLSNISF